MPVLIVLVLGWFCAPDLAFADQSDIKPATSASGPTIIRHGEPKAPQTDADPLGSLDAGQLQDLLQWLSRHAPDPAALSQEALNRAALRSLLSDRRAGAAILKNQDRATVEAAFPPLHAPLGPAAAYARPGVPNMENVRSLSTFLTGLPEEVATLILDLRTALPRAAHTGQPEADALIFDGGEKSMPARQAVSSTALTSTSLAGSIALASLFLPERTPLYLLNAPPAAPALQVSATPPVWTRRVWLLVDNQTPPPAELAAHLLARHLHSLSFGSPTSGNLTETTIWPLGSRYHVRLPAATVAWPDGTRLTGTPLIPQVLILPRPASREALLTLTDPSRLSGLLDEKDRPRLNEAALLAGTPPELLTPPAASPDHSSISRPDPVLQQAIDLLQTAAFLKLDAPEEIKRADPAKVDK